MRILPIAAALSLLSASAAAQPGAPPPDQKSPGTGVGLAVAGSVIPAAAFGIGLSLDDADAKEKVVIFSLLGGLFLPSSGMYYAGQKRTIGQYPRAGALVTLAIAALSDGLGEGQEADTWYAISGALYGVGCVIDIAMTPGAVRAHNARQPPVAVAPTLLPGGAGLAVTGAF